MKDRITSTSREWHGDREEIARLLPPPADWDVPREQHLRHKDLLMRTIDRAHAERARPVRRLLRPALLVPTTALALACALSAGIALTDSGKGASGTASHGAATDMQPAAALLDRISAAAGEHPAPTVRDDQFVYTKEKTRSADLTTGKAVLGPLTDREVWYAQEPGPLLKPGLIREDGKTFPINAELGDTHGTAAGINRPTYQWLSSLPTDPDKLLTYLYTKTPHTKGRERDQAVFEQIGSLLGAVMPPRTAAALYQAAAKIPGVTPAPKARDAIGRQGLGIARDDTRYGIRTEWVFDKKDYTFLGSRSYLTKDETYGESGTLLSSSAELDHAVVDKAGESPAAG
ncbi:CU044_5270 family protein [Streptomyces sp. 8P21H-1]|uniref:CU044_5270 family protein n=1 Tax=Streptomyces sp. 8P21H-1 TaxID=2737048 RepID=UPI001570692F|nr:CU044_5270 family protein [Streptomyces sp. 8P21H-1]NSL43345.1 CU044_5270 family protein [Streptomyces sp. 8P21H-1]